MELLDNMRQTHVVYGYADSVTTLDYRQKKDPDRRQPKTRTGGTVFQREEATTDTAALHPNTSQSCVNTCSVLT